MQEAKRARGAPDSEVAEQSLGRLAVDPPLGLAPRSLTAQLQVSSRASGLAEHTLRQHGSAAACACSDIAPST